jgi:MFS family permease
MTKTETAASAASGIVLATLASGQFLMTLDSAVMNVSIATVASDVGTTVTGIQTAITLYTLVMAALMITGGKIGEIIGRKRAFSIGCVIYGCGSFTTSLAPNLTVLIIGWSFLEGIGAALIMPAIVALVASNFSRADRPRAYGLVASAGAIAVAAGPLIGGLFTTYASWRWVFACEVIVVAGILALSRRMADAEPASPRPRLDLVGTVLSATSLALIVLGVLKSGEWGLITPKAGQPDWFGLSPVVWMILGGGVVMWGFLAWERRRIDTGKEPLVDPELLEVEQLRGGLISFFFQYLLQAGLFFAVPLFLSVALGLSAIATGVRLLPLSVTLLLAAAGIPKVFPKASPRLVVQAGFVAILVGIAIFIAALDAGAGPEIVTWPMLLIGLGIGALASQLGAVTVSAVSDEDAGQVGGIQNTVTNLGASIGTALAGAALIAALTSSFFANLSENPDVPAEVTASAEVELAAGVPFVSDAQLEGGLEEAGVDPTIADAVIEANEDARIDALRISLGALALLAVLALFATRRLPRTPASGAADTG